MSLLSRTFNHFTLDDYQDYAICTVSYRQGISIDVSVSLYLVSRAILCDGSQSYH